MTTIIAAPRSAVRATSTLLAGSALLFGLAACGGSSAGSTATAGTIAAGNTSTGAPGESSIAGPGSGQGGRQRFDPAQLQKIRECLTAAGIDVVLPSGRPSGFGSGTRPSDFPSGSRPSDFPSGSRPSGARGGFGAVFADPKVKAALDACGIAVPSFGPRPGGGAGGATPAAS